MSDLTPRQIEQKLIELPAKIYKYATEAIALETAWRIADEQAELEFSKLYMVTKAKFPEMKQAEIQAVAKEGTSSLRLAAIVKQGEFKAMRTKSESCSDMLSCLQSTVKLRVAEITSTIG